MQVVGWGAKWAPLILWIEKFQGIIASRMNESGKENGRKMERRN